MTPGPLLEDKLTPPTLRVEPLVRSRLIELLSRASEHPVTALNAPAGAGKTALLTTWKATSEAHHVGWLTLDDSDNRPPVFWAYLLQAVRRNAQETDLGPLDDLAVPDEIDERFLDLFLSAVAKLAHTLVLVLDDVHRLRNPQLLWSVERLIRNAPECLRFILSGRTQPDLRLARLRVAGDLVDVGYRDLACTAEEAGDLLRVLGVCRTETEIARIVERTDGWIAGLRLAALGWRSGPAEHRAAFSACTPVVADYLRDEVFSRRNARTQRFMVLTCLVDQLSADLADRLTGGNDGARVLETLAREEAFVTVVDAERTWFRYNPLFRDFLRAQLAYELPSEIRALHQRAAHWFAQHQMIMPALDSAAAAEDWRLATLLLVEAARPPSRIHPGELTALLDRLPDGLVQRDGSLALLYAEQQLSHRDPDRAEPYLRIAERTPIASGTGSLGAELRQAELRLRQATLRGRISGADLERATTLLRRAESAMDPQAQDAVVRLAYRLGVGQACRGDTTAARAAFTLVDQHDQLTRSGLGSLSASWQNLLNAFDGRLSAVDPAAGNAYLDILGAALAAYGRDQLGRAWQLVQPDVLEDAPDADFPVAAAAQLFRAQILVVREEWQPALVELEQARQVSTLAAHLSHYADLIEAAAAMRRGDLESARRTLAAATADAPLDDLAIDKVAMGRLYLAEHAADAALDTVQPCLDGTAANPRLVDIVAAHLVSAAAQRARGRPGSAEEELERALKLAAPEGLVRVFLDTGRSTRALLTTFVRPHGPYASTRTLLLHHFERQATLTAKPPADAAPKLTRSEQHVLRYLPSHLTNEEIAEDLYLSVHTVKSHLRTLYRKLGARNRRDAIASAHQLGLLD